MKRTCLSFLVAAGVALQAGTVVWPFLVRRLTLILGQSVLFETSKMHPADMIRGSHRVYAKEVNWTLTLDQMPNIRTGESLYLTFSTNAQGLARFDGLKTERPSVRCLYMTGVLGGCYAEQMKIGVQTNRTEYARYSSMSVVDVMKPTGKYKVHVDRLKFDDDVWPHGLPPRSEEGNYSRWPKTATQARIRLWWGHAVVEDVLFDGRPSREYISEMVKQQKDRKQPK